MMNWMENEAKEREMAVDMLNQAFTDRYQSVAQYILESQPYVGPGDAALLENIKAIAEFDRREAERLADLIESHEGIPQCLAPYPHDIAEMNYLALPFLAGVLAGKLEQQANRYQASVSRLRNTPQAADALSALIIALRAHAATLNA